MISVNQFQDGKYKNKTKPHPQRPVRIHDEIVSPNENELIFC